MITAAARLKLAALTTAHVRKELKALKRVPKFKYLDCGSSTLQSAELLRRPGKNAKKVEKTKKRASYRNWERRTEGKRAQMSPTALCSVYRWAVFMCKTYANTLTHAGQKAWPQRPARRCVTCMCDLHVHPAGVSFRASQGPDASWFRFIRFNQHLIYTWDANWIQFISAEENQQRFSGREMNLCLLGPADVCCWASRSHAKMKEWRPRHMFFRNVAFSFFGSTKAMRRCFRCSRSV